MSGPHSAASATSTSSSLEPLFFTSPHIASPPTFGIRPSLTQSTKMNRLGVMLAELNLSQYHLTLATAAYGTWEDVMNITDNDL